MPLRFRAPDPALRLDSSVKTVPPTSAASLDSITPAQHQPEIDHYLAQVDACLKRLPSAIRFDAQLELRQHLESLIAAQAEIGDEASAAGAIRLLGSPATIAGRYRRAWLSPAHRRLIETLRETARFAALSCLAGYASFAALDFLVSQTYRLQRQGFPGVDTLINPFAMTFLGLLNVVVPLLIGRHFGKRWARSGKSDLRFWVHLAVQATLWSTVQMFLLEMTVVSWRTFGDYTRWQLPQVLERQWQYALPIALLAALYTRRRRIDPSPRVTVAAYLAFAGLLLIRLTDCAGIGPNIYADIAFAVDQWYFPGLLAIVCLFGIRRIIRSASSPALSMMPL